MVWGAPLQGQETMIGGGMAEFVIWEVEMFVGITEFKVCSGKCEVE